MAASKRIAVVGSVNLDHLVRVERRPGGGETVLGSELISEPGGKGANQAVAAARLGADVALIGCVGDDAAGRMLASRLRETGIDVRALDLLPDTPTGAAFITVSPDGENAIVVAPGANAAVTAERVRGAAAALPRAAVWATQMEVPAAVVEATAEAAASARARFVLNLAPYADLAADVLARADPLVVNEHEASALLGVSLTGAADVVEASERLLDRASSVVVTLGARGAVLVAPGGVTERIAAPPRAAVDTTGAGDAFVGALAAGLAEGRPLLDSVRLAVQVASYSVTRRGAQPSYPTVEELQRR